MDLEAYQDERTKVREERNKWIKEAPRDRKKAATSAFRSARMIGAFGIRRNFAEGELLKRIWLDKNTSPHYIGQSSKLSLKARVCGKSR